MTTRILFLSLLVLLPVSGHVFAQATSTEAISSSTPEKANWFTVETIEGVIDAGDFVVGPGRSEINVSPGETVTKEITVTNRISDKRTFRLAIDDITGSADGSSAVTLTDGARGPFSIRDYVSFPDTTFTLGLGERARIPVTITIPANAEPGGVYGSVLVSTDQTPEELRQNESRSPVIARIGSLLFVTIQGDVVTEGQTKGIRALKNGWWYEKGPITLALLYENTGSVHVNPYGTIRISNLFGEEVGFIDLDPWFVLPKSLRSRDVTWDREFLFGRYTAIATVHRGYGEEVDVVETTFWVLPWKIIGSLFVGIFIIIFGIRVFFRTFTFTRRSK
jgi:hypothetical protein